MVHHDARHDEEGTAQDKLCSRLQNIPPGRHLPAIGARYRCPLSMIKAAHEIFDRRKMPLQAARWFPMLDLCAEGSRLRLQ
jgi:hypothetical protein